MLSGLFFINDYENLDLAKHATSGAKVIFHFTKVRKNNVIQIALMEP